MKKLTQEVFKNATPDVKSACVCKDGFGELWSVPAKNLHPSGGEFLSSGAPITYSYPLGHGFDATDWQNSAIDREVTA